MPKLIEISPKKNMHVFLKYSDGTEGEINLLHLKENNEYKILSDNTEFQKVGIDPNSNDLMWECGISICRDASYKLLKLRNQMKNLRIDLNKI